MGKVRVYELAKELNTNSKRLMEKLAEIKIEVKNHMSQLEDNELQALYKHIGVKNSAEKKEDDDKKAQSVVKTERKDKSAPRIIRKTEINLDTNSQDLPYKSAGTSSSSSMRNDKNSNDRRGVFVGSNSDNSGLMTGFTRNKTLETKKFDNNRQEKNIDKESRQQSPINRANDGLEHKNSEHSAIRQEEMTWETESEKHTENVSREKVISESFNPQEGKQPKKTQSKANIITTEHQASGEKETTETSLSKDIEKNEKTDIKKKENESDREEKTSQLFVDANQMSQERAPNNVDTVSTNVPKYEERQTPSEVQPHSSNTIPQSGTVDRGQQGSRERRPYQGSNDRGQYGSGDRPQQGSYERRPYQGSNDRGQQGSGDRPQQSSGDRPQQGSYERRPYQGSNDRGQQGYGDRPQQSSGDRPQQGSYERRPYQGSNDRGQQGSGDRPQQSSGDRPQQSSGDRPQQSSGDRPQQGSYERRPYQGSNDRPRRPYEGNQDRPQNYSSGQNGDRPQGDRPQGDRAPYRSGNDQRPSYNDNRPRQDGGTGGQSNYQRGNQQGGFSSGARPYQQGGSDQRGGSYRPSYQQGGDNRAGGNRPPYENRPRPQGGTGEGDRFQNKPRDNRGGPDNRGGRPPYGGQKNDRPHSGGLNTESLLPVMQKPESKRVYENKDSNRSVDRETKKDLRKDAVKPTVVPDNNLKNKKVALGEKKGISEVLSEDYILNEFYSDDNAKRRFNRPKGKQKLQPVYIAPKPVILTIKLSGSVTVKELAEAMKKTSTDVIKKLMKMEIMATVNQELDVDIATIIAEEFGIIVEREVIVSEEDILFDDEDDKDEDVEPRPPVVVVMGHVDHGKTSLLDAIRETNVIDSEAGGITQHIGAYMVKVNDRDVTFLDTPGHEAFTAMRARGAQVTDIAILVVAADDGIMPQTVEAINHAKAANVSIIVAINKIDKPGANPGKVKEELTKYGIVSDEWGGDVICVPVSAKNRTNIDQLLEMIILTADILELKAGKNKQAKGTVIEARLDRDRGPLATVLVQRGTLKIGDSIVTGMTVGRIRALLDDKGHKVKVAGPSMPVEILGLPMVPEVGEIFYAIEDEKVAKQLAEKRRHKQREVQLKSSSRVSLEDLYAQIKAGKVKDLNLIVKADVQGSVEAVRQSLEKLRNDEVKVNIIHGGVGTINESDVTFASVSNAIIIGFNVRPSANIVEAAKTAGVDLRLYRVIYKAVEDIEAALKGMLEPTYREVVLGHIEIRQLFKASGIGTIGGGYVIDGKVGRNNDIRVVRDGLVVHEGKLGSLKRFKDDAKEVIQGYECGFTMEKFQDLKMEDIIECFEMEEVKR